MAHFFVDAIVPFWHIGSMKLSEYLAKEGLTPDQFATRLGVHRSTITRYINGARRPERPLERRIMEVTAGAVTPLDFMTDQAGAP